MGTMSKIEKTVFISYRHANYSWALSIYQYLTQHGFNVFSDFQKIDSGDFERIILANIESRAHFIVLLTPSALKGCSNSQDWLHREIEFALKKKRNIVPIMLDGFKFNKRLIKRHLKGELSALHNYNGVEIHWGYFEAGMQKLVDKYLNKSIDSVIHPLSLDVQQITKLAQIRVSEESRVSKQQLTAQEWFEKGCEATHFKEKIKCFDEAIRNDPKFAEAYLNRCISYYKKGKINYAIMDYNNAIQFRPDLASQEQKEVEEFREHLQSAKSKNELNNIKIQVKEILSKSPDSIAAKLLYAEIIKVIKRPKKMWWKKCSIIIIGIIVFLILTIGILSLTKKIVESIQDKHNSIKTSTLSGFVVDMKTRESIQRAIVKLDKLPNDSTTSANDGSFSFLHVPGKENDTVSLDLCAHGYNRLTKKTTLPGPVTIELVKISEQTLNGIVTDQTNGRPIKNATISISNLPGGRTSTTTAVDGTFILEVHTQINAPFQCNVQAPGYQNFSASYMNLPNFFEIKLRPSSQPLPKVPRRDIQIGEIIDLSKENSERVMEVLYEFFQTLDKNEDVTDDLNKFIRTDKISSIMKNIKNAYPNNRIIRDKSAAIKVKIGGYFNELNRFFVVKIEAITVSSGYITIHFDDIDGRLLISDFLFQ
ncbi:carboxypeptidase regulatory-like domain-containing protein [candidate division KSB1 bacterium]|nr:carboxypeptidase regulatory-like domain-containing protein [candidate division KSB1 bacterium]